MQLIGQLFQAALTRRGERVTIVGATSATPARRRSRRFAGSTPVDVFILFPHGRVSRGAAPPDDHAGRGERARAGADRRFRRLPGAGEGHVQRLRLPRRVRLAAVNSINWARVLAQVVYYFTSAVALGAPHRAVSFTVPTGNFGDIFAGYIARRMGLPIDRWSSPPTRTTSCTARCQHGRLRARRDRRRSARRWTSRSVVEFRARAVRCLWPRRRAVAQLMEAN
jgi:threonine synthase